MLDIGTGIIIFSYAALILLILVFFSKIVLFLRIKKSQFSDVIRTVLLMVFVFIVAELLHFVEMRSTLFTTIIPMIGPDNPAPQAELLYSLGTVIGFAIFALLMHQLFRLSSDLGFAKSEFVAMLNVQRRLCPICKRVDFKISYSELIAEKIINPDGTLQKGITLSQLIDRGIAVHKPHPRKS